MTLFDRRTLLELLADLAARLHRQGIRGELFVVGGAAMALAYSDRRSTRDVDAVFEPKLLVYEAARAVARARGDLPEDWLNDAVKGFLPGPDAHARTVLDLPGLRVSVASPRYLLALKLLAARVEQDEADISELYRQCGFTTAEEGLALLAGTYPGRNVLPKVQFLLEEMFPSSTQP